MKVRSLVAAAALTVVALVSTSAVARADFFQFIVQLDGIQEVNGAGQPAGDADGTGTAVLLINTGPAIPTISWNITVNNIVLPPTGAHIHQAPAGSNGPILVDFAGQLTGANLADTDLTAILANPTNYYVNVHNSVFPAGAIRGQLPAQATAVPEPGTLALAGLGLLPIAALARRRRKA